MRNSIAAGIGLVAVVVGAVWIGQGAGLIPGSFMTGQTLWLVIGIVVAVVGVFLIGYGARRRGGRA